MITSIVDAVLANLSSLIPAKIVHSYQRGVKFRWGADIAELGTGVHWFWPLAESIEVISRAEDVIDLPTQTITTKDGQPVTFSVNVSFSIEDARAYWVNVQDFEHSIRAACMVFLSRRIRTEEWATLYATQDELEKSLKRSLGQQVKRWGVEIRDVGITDLSRAKPIRLYQTGT